MSDFKFKQFEVAQNKSAMKIGTDGVLLGSWSNLENSRNILDIGCGTGLICLMAAQRNQSTLITGIELEVNAFKQATENCKKSNWSNRISIIHSSLQSFNSNSKFDLIISNPPFFSGSTKSEHSERNLARNTHTLAFKYLIEKSKALLDKNGKFIVIIPFACLTKFCDLANNNNLFLNKICFIKGNISSPIKRIMMEFSFTNSELIEEELTIEVDRHQYTKEYISLCKDFYLKM
ncbi:methyltransferase [Flavobacteriales bacterium]|nr:methyltransferase [Flavobacteriales bacterium]